MPLRTGFDNEKYLSEQTSAILERVRRCDNKLYLEFGGKLLYDYHAARVLPGFDPNVKMRLLQKLRDNSEVLLCIYAGDIERRKVRADFGITYDSDTMKLIDDLREWGIEVAAVVITRYDNQPSAAVFKNKYLPEESKVIYESKACPRHGSGNAQREKVFDALEWMAAMSSHVPDKGEQMVRYYGYYSNVSRGKRKKRNQDEGLPCILEPEGSSKEYRKNWARLIQKIYEMDPLTCPKCQGQMRIIAFIEDEEVIQKILRHLGLWEAKARPPPKAKVHSVTIYLDDSESQISSPDSFYAHPDYQMDSYVS